jgi:hypothetical protein
LIVHYAHELHLIETLYHRTTADPVSPVTLRHVYEVLDSMDYRIREYLADLDAEAAERFLAIPISPDESVLTALTQKRRVLEDFIHDPKFFPPPPTLPAPRGWPEADPDQGAQAS